MVARLATARAKDRPLCFAKISSLLFSSFFQAALSKSVNFSIWYPSSVNTVCPVLVLGPRPPKVMRGRETQLLLHFCTIYF